MGRHGVSPILFRTLGLITTAYASPRLVVVGEQAPRLAHSYTHILERKTMKALKITKFVVGAVVAVGAGKIAGHIIRNNVTPRSGFEAVTMATAAFVLCGMVGAMAANESDKQIDEFIKAWKQMKENYAEAKNAV